MLMFMEDFYSYAHEEYRFVVFFIHMSLSGFGIRVILVSKNELGSILPPLLSERVFVR